jgi:hypothetical protein
MSQILEYLSPMLTQLLEYITPALLQVQQFTSTHTAAVYASFALGFTLTFKEKKMITHPLSTFYNSTIMGIIFVACISTFYNSIPDHLKFVIPLASLIICHYRANKYNNDNRKKWNDRKKTWVFDV